MAYKTILAVLDSPQNAGQVSAFGAALAQQFSAHLVGVHAEALASVPLIAPMEIPDPAAVQVLQERAQRQTAEIEEIYKEVVERQGPSNEWRAFISAAGYGSSSVIETARTADLIIASQSDPEQTDHRADLETLLFESGRPLLLIPHVHKDPQPIRRVLIGWNGSREAARATFDSLPFLKAAENVEIFTVDPSDRGGQTPELAGAEIAASLARQGVNVTLTTQPSGGLSAADAIANRLAESGSDLLVMGGYGQSRWWEALFGGVTRSLLDSMTAPTLLSR